MTHLHVLDPNPNGNPPILLLHGLGATGASWSLQLPVFSEAGFRPLAPDAPGFGDSSYDRRGWNIPRVAAQMAEFVDEIGASPVHVVGLSMGGVIAQEFARNFPEMTRKLVLTSTFSMLRPENISGWYYFFRRMLAVVFLGLPAQAKIVANRVFPEANQDVLREMLVTTIAGADKQAYRAAMRSLGLFDSRKWLGQITAPTLVITGEKDTTVSPRLQNNLVQGIRGARQVLIRGAGHAVPVDQANEFNRILLEFLR